jgi:hypothetical protein
MLISTAMSAEHHAAFNRLYEVAVPRHQQKWVEYVASLPSKRAMYEVIGGGSYSTFTRRARSRQGVENEARTKFRISPKSCVDQMGIHDAEVNELAAKAEVLEIAKDAFWDGIEKRSLPLQ